MTEEEQPGDLDNLRASQRVVYKIHPLRQHNIRTTHLLVV